MMKPALRRLAELAVLTCLAISGTGELHAFSCSPKPPPQIDSAKDYVRSFADALVLLRAARESSRELKNSTPSKGSIAVLQTAGQQYECANSYLAPYSKSRNDSVAESAKFVNAGTATLASVNGIFIQRYRASLDGKSEYSLARQETNEQLIKLANEASILVVYAANAACLALIEVDHDKKQRLAVTTQERAALIKTIENDFRPQPTGAAAAGSPLENSAVLLLDFLRDTTRKSHDEN